MSRSRTPKGHLLIHVDERRRDIVILCALKELFEEQGVEVILSTRRTTPRLLREVPFDAVILPSMNHVSWDHYEEICGRFKIFVLPTDKRG